jgi:hypothetical protein
MAKAKTGTMKVVEIKWGTVPWEHKVVKDGESMFFWPKEKCEEYVTL